MWGERGRGRGTRAAESGWETRTLLSVRVHAQCEGVQKRGVPCSKLRPREKSPEKSPQIWKPAFLTLGFRAAAFSSDACSYREGGQSSC